VRIDKPSAIEPAAVRRLIHAALRSDSDLDAFLIDHFRSVEQCLSTGMDRVQKVNLLLKHCELEEIISMLRTWYPDAYQRDA
jgi:hypothetical protein